LISDIEHEPDRVIQLRPEEGRAANTGVKTGTPTAADA
jgi:hypothetical protein